VSDSEVTLEAKFSHGGTLTGKKRGCTQKSCLGKTLRGVTHQVVSLFVLQQHHLRVAKGEAMKHVFFLSVDYLVRCMLGGRQAEMTEMKVEMKEEGMTRQGEQSLTSSSSRPLYTTTSMACETSRPTVRRPS